VSDPSLKDRIAELTATREQAKGDAERAMSHKASQSRRKSENAAVHKNPRANVACLRFRLASRDG